MHLDRLLLAVLYALSAAACIGVLNARGVARTAVAALLALFCLGAALWATGESRAARLAGWTGAVAPSASATASAPVAASPAAHGTAPSRVDPSDGADLLELLAATRALHAALSAEDPSGARALSDAEYRELEQRAVGHRARARLLRERVARLASAPPAGQEGALEALGTALQGINAGARDLQEFFRAPTRDAELRLLESARTALGQADGPLREAEAFSPAAR